MTIRQIIHGTLVLSLLLTLCGVAEWLFGDSELNSFERIVSVLLGYLVIREAAK